MSSEDLRGTNATTVAKTPLTALGPGAELGGSEARKKLEGLLFILDARMSILIAIYIVNYVSYMRQIGFRRVFRNSLHTD